MSPLPLLSAITQTAAAALLAFACWTAPAQASSEATTFQGASLPGRLIVNSSLGDAFIADLQTGQRTALPRMSSGPRGSEDQWMSSPGPLVLRWYGNSSWRGEVPLFVFDSRTWTPLASSKVYSQFSFPKLSADGRYILAFWQNGSANEGIGDRQLTIFDSRSGKPLKRGSRLDGKLIVGNPAAWLPDGRYVYRMADKIYLSSPTSREERLIAQLRLPQSVGLGGPTEGGHMAVSPDGAKVAFTLGESRGNTGDIHIWVMNLDGSNLHRLTSAPDSSSPLKFSFISPTWSPDSRWVAGVLRMQGTVAAPVFPSDETVAPAWKVIGATGCGSSPVFVLPADARNAAISWPRYDARYNVKVRAPSGRQGQWLSTCESVAWIP